MGITGVLIAIALIIFLAYRGWGMIPASMVASLVVILSSGGDIWESFSVNYVDGLKYFAGTYFLIFILGSLFGQVMGDSGSAKAISYKVIEAFGSKKAILITIIATALLTYGGVNLFIVVFTVYPISKILFDDAGLPKRLLAACIACGGATFTMTALPASPSIQNIIPTQVLGTDPTAAPVLGIIAGVMLFGSSYWYLSREGERALASLNEVETGAGRESNVELDFTGLPDWRIALLPMLLVVSFIIIFKSAFPPLMTVCIGLMLGIISAYALNWNKFESHIKTLNIGAGNSVMALINTSCVVAFGFVVRGVPAFGNFMQFAFGLDFPPLISSAVAVNIIAGIVGSASGGLTIFMQTMGQSYLDMGIHPEVLHRLSALASGGLDSLPHSGAIITLFSVMGLTHKEAYRDIGVVTVLLPIVVTAVSIGLAVVMY